jgi:very-short-patch-repair endonuclease
VGGRTSEGRADLRGLRKLIGHARTLRRRPTNAEERLWRRLRGKQLGVRFRRQHPIAGYIVDFYCAPARLVIELDGGGHASEEQRRYDARRDRELTRRGLQVLRVWNPEVVSNPEAVLERIWAYVHGGDVRAAGDREGDV